MRRLVLIALACMSTAAGAQVQCGIPPIPPVGCRVGPCVCDANGDNCHWEMICSR